VCCLGLALSSTPARRRSKAAHASLPLFLVATMLKQRPLSLSPPRSCCALLCSLKHRATLSCCCRRVPRSRHLLPHQVELRPKPSTTMKCYAKQAEVVIHSPLQAHRRGQRAPDPEPVHHHLQELCPSVAVLADVATVALHHLSSLAPMVLLHPFTLPWEAHLWSAPPPCWPKSFCPTAMEHLP
jgi:hypothetical protein